MNAINPSLAAGLPISSGACVDDEPGSMPARRITSAEIQAALEHLARLMMARAKSADARFVFRLEANPTYGFDLMVTAGDGTWGDLKPIYGSPIELRGSLPAIDLSAAVGAMDGRVAERLTFFAACEADKARALAFTPMQAAE
jgi:hypothetical protein